MVTEAEILAVLRTIPDPEMPISIVDLGIVHEVSIERCDASGMPKRSAGMLALGAKVERYDVSIQILPTFVGCPALRVIEEQIFAKVAHLPGVGTVHVDVMYDPPWTVDRISPEGRAALAEVGVTAPHAPRPLIDLKIGSSADQSPVACPFCKSRATQLESAFGPTRCKMIYYCPACGNSFEHLKDLR